MGKTHRKVNAGSCSVDYHSPHNRGFAKDKKRNSHHKIRTFNRGLNIDNLDENIDVLNCKQPKMNSHWAASYYGEYCNFSNMQGFNLDDKALYEDCKYKWNQNDTTQLDTFNTILNNHNDNNWPAYNNFIKNSKKQLERRGTATQFYGHR